LRVIDEKSNAGKGKPMKFAAMVERINSHVEREVEYETTHKDAGDNYAHMPAESWHSDHDSRVIEYCKEKGIDISGIDPDCLACEILDGFHMESGHMWSYGNGGLLIESYPISEIEIELESELIGRDFHPALIDRLNKECDCYIRYNDKKTAYAYITTDCIWGAVLSEADLREIVQALRNKD
jgi:hypothetical protein